MRTVGHVDHGLCYGTGMCEAMDPRQFQLTDEGLAVFVVSTDGNDSGADTDRLREIADCCPAGAITVTSAQG